jgi:hypothetical protein
MVGILPRKNGCHQNTLHESISIISTAGALIATIAFNYLDTQGIFYVCAAVSAASIPVTLLFLCDLGQMDLIENDRYLEMILTGRVGQMLAILNYSKTNTQEALEKHSTKFSVLIHRLLSVGSRVSRGSEEPQVLQLVRNTYWLLQGLRT